MTGPADEAESERTRLVGPGARLAPQGRRAWLIVILVLALALRLPGFTDPYGAKGFRSVIGAFGTAEFAQNYVQHGFLESGLMPVRTRIELADGTLVREWYAHHPAWFAVVTGAFVAALGDEPWAGRLPWLLASLWAGWALWRLLETVWGGRVALTGLFAYAVAPIAAHYATMPWVDNGTMLGVHALALRQYALWLRDGAPRRLRWAAAWVFAGGLLDWTMHLLLAGIGVHALVTCARDRAWRRLAATLLLPAAALASAAVHAAHMALVMPFELVIDDTSTTLERTASWSMGLERYARLQWGHLSRGLQWPLLALVVLGAARQTVLAVFGRLTREDWLLPLLLVPGVLYVGLFPFRGANHDFMWMLAIGYFAGTAGIEMVWLADRIEPLLAGLGRVVLGVLVAACLTFGTHHTLRLWRETRSDALARLAAQEWFGEVFDEPDNVVLTPSGNGMALLVHSAAPIVPRVMTPAQLERQKERVLSKLGPGRRAYFLIDRNPLLLAHLKPLHDLLLEVGVLESDGEREPAEGEPAFDLFDLTDWANE